jgi:hypothetical protein
MPGRDTPEALREVAQYRQLPSGEFSHSTIISALAADGKIVVQSAELGSADPEVLRALNAP